MLKRGPALLGGALLLGAVSLVVVPSSESAARFDGAASSNREAKADSRRREAGIERAHTALTRKIRALSVREVRDELPAVASLANFAKMESESAQRALVLFQRFGELEGEAALDELVTRYGAGRYTAHAMAAAIAGWMERDPKAALAALQSMTTKSGPLSFLSLLEWKGVQLVSGMG